MHPHSIRLVTHGYEDIYGITMQDAKIFQSVISPKGDKNPLLTHFGHWVHPQRRQATGPLPKPRWMPLPQLLYAPVVKPVRRRRLVRVRHRVVFGTLEAVQQVLAAGGWQINTAFVERLNLTIRQHVAAIGRRVTTLCKGEEGLR